MSYYAGRGGGAAPAAGGGGGRAPSGGGSGPSAPRITPSAGGGGGTTRPQKTQVLNHVEQSSIGGPGARPAGGDIGHQVGGMRPNIGEHQGVREGDNRAPGQRDERGHPDQFRNFDQRFDRDRDRLGNNYWRTAFTDYELDRFSPLLAEDPFLYSIFGVNYYPELIQYAVPFYPTTCGPWNEGLWVIGADSRWWPVRRHQLNIIRRIEAERMIGRYEPVIIPNCGVGGGLYPSISPYPVAPTPIYPAPYPAGVVAPAYPRVSYPYLI